MELRLVFLGTSSAVPTKERGLSSIALARGGELLLFDAGEGTQRQMIKAGVGFKRETKIFITHMHADHVAGLLGILQTMAMMERERSLHVFGPPNIEGFIENNRSHLNFHLGYPVITHTVKEGVVLETEEYVVKAAKAHHSIPTFAYSFEEKQRPGRFDPDRARKLGVPEGRLWSELQRGHEVAVKGKIVRPNQVLGSNRPGRKICVSGDTRPTLKLARFFSNADVMVFDSTYEEKHKDKAKENLHSTAKEAAWVAKRATAKLLVLSHFSARYSDASLLEEEARKIHRNVLAASDMTVLKVPYPDQGSAVLLR